MKIIRARNELDRDNAPDQVLLREEDFSNCPRNLTLFETQCFWAWGFLISILYLSDIFFSWAVSVMSLKIFLALKAGTGSNLTIAFASGVRRLARTIALPQDQKKFFNPERGAPQCYRTCFKMVKLVRDSSSLGSSRTLLTASEKVKRVLVQALFFSLVLRK